MPRRYRKLRGDTAYYPFAARTGLRARQRRHARLLRVLGIAALALAAVLLVRQTVFRGGQPNAPAPIAAAQTTAPGQAHVTVAPVAATRDAGRYPRGRCCRPHHAGVCRRAHRGKHFHFAAVPRII